MGRQVWVSARVAGPPDRLWRLTQDTGHHPRWDLRFSAITPAGTDADGHQRSTYALALPHPRLPLLTVRGSSTSTAERRGDDGAGTSAIRFAAGHAPADRLSPWPAAPATGATHRSRTAGPASPPATTTSPAGAASAPRSTRG